MTTDIEHGTEHEAPPPEMVEQVADALEHLYELNHLERHPLAQDGKYRAQRSVENAGQHLRSELVQAIESLSPGPSVSFHAPQARVHNLLVLHYVECRTVQEAAHMADISRRQAHRDLRQGVETVSAVLWERRCASTSKEPRVSQLSSVESEVARLEHHPTPTDVCILLKQAQDTVQRLAAQRDVHFDAVIPRHAVIVPADPALAQQVLVNLLSNAVQQAQPGTVRLVLTAEETGVSITIQYSPEPEAVGAPPASVAIAEVADQMGWTVTRKDHANGMRTVTMHMKKHGPSVLVIDDNEGLVKLVGRYLTDQACQVIAATNGEEGLLLAQEHKPDVVMLDVMIPQVHGWEVLQRLRHHPETSGIPVIICSVINDPELAYSLGASLFLPKPVSRPKILQALRQLGIL
jgi:CheY-like chemotaxis protein